MSIGPLPISRSFDLVAQGDLSSTAASDLQHLAPHPSFHFLTERREQAGPLAGSPAPSMGLLVLVLLLAWSSPCSQTQD